MKISKSILIVNAVGVLALTANAGVKAADNNAAAAVAAVGGATTKPAAAKAKGGLSQATEAAEDNTKLTEDEVKLKEQIDKGDPYTKVPELWDKLSDKILSPKLEEMYPGVLIFSEEEKVGANPPTTKPVKHNVKTDLVAIIFDGTKVMALRLGDDKHYYLQTGQDLAIRLDDQTGQDAAKKFYADNFKDKEKRKDLYKKTNITIQDAQNNFSLQDGKLVLFNGADLGAIGTASKNAHDKHERYLLDEDATIEYVAVNDFNSKRDPKQKKIESLPQLLQYGRLLGQALQEKLTPDTSEVLIKHAGGKTDTINPDDFIKPVVETPEGGKPKDQFKDGGGSTTRPAG